MTALNAQRLHDGVAGGARRPLVAPGLYMRKMLHHFSEMRRAARWSSWQDRTPVAKRDFGKEWVPGSIPGRCSQKKQRATHATNDRHALYNLICYLSTIYYYLSTIYLIQSTTTGTEIPYPCSTEEVRRKNAVARPLDRPGLQERWLSPYKPEVVGSKPTGGIHTSAALQKRLVIA